jgi:pimeloyl-ACP methyl ester carboxylesterase
MSTVSATTRGSARSTTTGIEAPDWLTTTLSSLPSGHEVDVEGTVIRSYRWGRTTDPGVVLVHGGLCHAHWWDHIAPMLRGHHVVALDLSGHGDSGRRLRYDAHQWGREVLAAAQDAGLSRPVLVGHSMGGQAVAAAAADFPAQVGGVVTIDTRFNDEQYVPRNKPSRVFTTLDEAVAQFRPVHADRGGDLPDALLRHVAETSLRYDGPGWQWKRDAHYDIDFVRLRDLLPGVLAPVAVVRTEHGLVTQEMAAEMRTLLRAPAVDVELAAAGHNPMLEQPLALIAVLRTLLGAWFPTVISTTNHPVPGTGVPRDR